MSRPSVIVYGPKACGKTRNAEKLRKALQLDCIMDDWDGRMPVPATGALVLTNDRQAAERRPACMRLSYAHAARQAGIQA